MNHDEFEAEYDALPEDVQDELTAIRLLLEHFGPRLGRPHVDTLSGSKMSNLKEIRFSAADGEWRFAFAFDPKRRGVILVGGDKSGVARDRFYKPLIRRAEARFADWLKKG